MRKQQREAILALLEETYMGTETALNYSTPFELLVAVIMSAQCTDERVNKITARIFPKYNTPEKMGALSQEQLEEEIRDCGLFRSKAKNLLATCKMLTEEYNSVIPDTVEELMKLPGVGKQGHTIGLHSYLHEYQDIYSSKDAYFKDLKKIKQMVKQLIGIQVHYIRFPGGSSNRISKNYCHGIMSQLTREVIKQGYQYYDWNGDTTDASGDHIPTATIIKQATSETHQNIVLLAHDTDAKDTTVAALPSIIQYYKEKGYQFLGIDDESYYVHHDIQN